MVVRLQSETIGALMREAAATFGDAEAVVGNGTRLTFRELEARSAALARRLLGRAVAKGSRVGVSLGGGPDFIVALTATARIGAIAVPISTFARGRELLRLLRHGDLTAILTAEHVVEVDQIERLSEAVPGLDAAAGPWLALSSVPSLRWIEAAGSDPPPTWAMAPDEPGVAAADAALLEAMEQDVTPWDVALMIHTSGTTADPKGVPHLHDTVTFKARYLAECMQFAPGDRTYTSHPMFWIGGLVMSFLTSLVSGATSVWTERFEPGEVLEVIERERVTRLVVYPHQIEQLLAHPRLAATDRSSLRIADDRLRVAPGQPVPMTTAGERIALGMSETFGMYSWGVGEPTQIAPLESIQPGLEIRVVDEKGKAVADGETGEICIRGRAVTPGYHKQPRTVAFDAEGWFHTGDRGRVEGTTIRFLGRMTELIKTSGANVSPAEVQEALLALDGVHEAYVLPIPDPVRGQLVAAAVVPVAGRVLDPAALRQDLRQDLSPFKVPVAIAVFGSEEIPWTATFKVRRHELVRMIQERAAAAGA